MDFSIETSCTHIRGVDRRKNNIPVENNRRSGVDRRQQSVFNDLKKDVNHLDNKAAKTALNVLSAIPTLRRINSLPYELENENYSRALGVAMLAAANSPGDLREVGLALREGKELLKGNPFVYKGQHQAKFFQNTVLNPFIEKKSCLKNVLGKLDKTVYETGLGKFARKLLNIQEDTKILGDKIKFKGNPFQKMAGKALLRVPLLGLAASALFEIPSLVKSAQKKGSMGEKAKSFTKQLCKSISHITLVNGAIAIAGALLMPYGCIPALLGMAVGSAIGLKASKSACEKIDETIETTFS